MSYEDADGHEFCEGELESKFFQTKKEHNFIADDLVLPRPEIRERGWADIFEDQLFNTK